MKLHSIDSTATFAWNHNCLPLLATGTAAGAVDLNFSAQAALEIHNIFLPTKNAAIFSAATENRFNALAWSEPFEGRPAGVLVGAFDNGAVEFWDADVLIKMKDLLKASLKKSIHSAVKSLAFNSKLAHILVSGGSNGEILVWDVKTLAEPTTPGKPMTPMDEISCVAWNNSVGHIFASTSNNYTSIWDLKSKREVLHLSYNDGEGGRANFSAVAWHPTQSTKLITASESDGCPVILTWDLRNANAPEMVMKGHEKGVLSLDWCKKDPELLISSGKDNTTMIWNPITGKKLGKYPTSANWAFLTKFAPSAPDLFATASYDGKIIIQTLQDTSPPVVNQQKIQDESEFWNEISTVETTQKPNFDVIQAPNWLKRPCSVNFGFGSKLVIIKTDLDKKTSSIEINKVGVSEQEEKLDADFSIALESNDFSKVIDQRLEKSIDDTDKRDWELLKKLEAVKGDNKSLFEGFIGDASEDNEDNEAGESNEANATDFFENLESKFSGPFNLSKVADQKLIKLILNNKLDEAVDECIKQDKLTEALVLALDSNETIKSKVKKAFFDKNNSELSRIIYSASSKDISDIVSNVEIDDWKLIANSISAYCNNNSNDFNIKITELGDRIVGQNRDDAILCYLAGGAIDKISTIWLKELPEFESKIIKDDSLVNSPFDAHFNSLTNFAEKITAYRAITKINGTLTSDNDASKVILEYSTLLANNGEFDLASKFSKLLPEGMEGFKEYNERILGASTKPKNVTATTSVNQGSATKSRYASVGNNTTNNTGFNNSKPSAPPFTPSVPMGGSLRSNGYRPSVSSVPTVPPGTGVGTGAGVGAGAGGIISPRIGGAAGMVPPPTSGLVAPPTAAPVSSSTPPIVSHNNPYKPATTSTGPTNPYAAHNPYMRPSPVATPTPIAPPPSQIPSKPKYKEVTDGWNDLPETFKPKPEARRAASAVSLAPTQLNNGNGINIPQQQQQQQQQAPPPLGSKRPSITSPPIAPPSVGPPRVLSRTASRASVVSPRPGNTNPYAPAVPTTTNASPTPYAPPTPGGPITAPPSATNAYGLGPGSVGSPAAVNPYAPPSTSGNGGNNGSIIGPGASSVVSPRAHNHQPIKNPYAPPPMQSTPTTSRIPSGGVIPPKPIIPAPPMSNNTPPMGNNGPPIGNGTASAVPPPPPATTKYPPGDRSHISVEDAPIYETFNKIYQELKPNIPEKYTKHGEDMEKRLNILYDHLNNDDLLSTEAKQTLKEIAMKLSEKQYGEAGAMILSFASSFPDEVGNWHTGVKRLINMTEALT